MKYFFLLEWGVVMVRVLGELVSTMVSLLVLSQDFSMGLQMVSMWASLTV